MGKKQPTKSNAGLAATKTSAAVAAAASADKNKRKKPQKPANPDSVGGGVQGPVPVRKVPSWRGKHQIGLYAAGSFQNTAPSPKNLPAPPARWTRMGSSDAVPSSSEQVLMPPPPPVPLRRESSVVAELQGNLLYLTLAPQYPELAGRIVGMLLEGCTPEQLKDILGKEEIRAEAVAEALKVLREAGDEHALALAAQRAPGLSVAPPPLTVDVGAAHAAQAAADVATGLTPSLSGLMRMSPRVSSNPYMTANLLRGA